MKHNPTYLYMFLQGMPCIVTDRQKNWVFTSPSTGWKPTGDTWEVVYPTHRSWWLCFESLPELPDNNLDMVSFLPSGFRALEKTIQHSTTTLKQWTTQGKARGANRQTIRRSERPFFQAERLRTISLDVIARPKAPPNCYGTRLLMCLALVIAVPAFFVAYNGLAHRGPPSVPSMVKSQSLAAKSPATAVYNRFDKPPTPDMNSPAVKFAGADLAPPQDPDGRLDTVEQKSESATATISKKPVTIAKGHKAKATRLTGTNGRPSTRAADAQSYSPLFGMFGQFSARGLRRYLRSPIQRAAG